jgi:two-component system response regulator (stage 0 sporulation protein F)
MPGKKTMLVVDDHPDMRRSLEGQFLDEDFEVDTAADGEAALARMGAKDYDIVLLDMNLPKMDGMGVLKELKKLNKNPNIIMLTGIDDVQAAIESVKLGARDFLPKPYDPEELLHVVSKVLSSAGK